MSLLNNLPFQSHAGLMLPWKIDCDFLTTLDIETLAAIVGRKFAFSKIYGIPRGGARLAKALEKYIRPDGAYLIVDDVLTTGKSMEEARRRLNLSHGTATGVVIFARAVPATWIHPVFLVAEWARRIGMSQ